MLQLGDKELKGGYRFATALCGDRDVGLDLAHDAYLALLERQRSAPIREPYRYFLRAIRNTYYDRLRKQNRWQMQTYDEREARDMDFRGLEQLYITEERLRQTWRLLRPDERELLYLWAVEEWTVDEVAVFSDTPRGTLLARLHRLRKRLASDNDAGTAHG